ncbi:unnamed protein product [Adineta steineri]|uniref:Uncharacterized protein n=1 Tax=Adineta steineri TaxID=433720 RepID=A0A815YN07_9BILA|nr:unnamed protein product [Adineta steineri]CAF1669881.1 unnamed protein product [Adineta steineri]
MNLNRGQIIADGNRSRNNQLNCPTDIIFDKENNSFIISDWRYKRVIRYFDQNQQITISNVDCHGLSIDENGLIYVSDCNKHGARRWKQGDKKGELVTGGNGQKNHFNQLNSPNYICIHEDDSLYISDWYNHCCEGDAEGEVIVGGNGKGNQLNSLIGLSFDNENIYVVDNGNHRIQKIRTNFNFKMVLIYLDKISIFIFENKLKILVYQKS